MYLLILYLRYVYMTAYHFENKRLKSIPSFILNKTGLKKKNNLILSSFILNKTGLRKKKNNLSFS